MTVALNRLVNHLNTLLQVDSFSESAINGLQVQGKKQVSRIAFAVDGVLETFQRAVEGGADLLIVHHGMYWGRQWALRGPDYQRVKTLMDAQLGLYAVHLPLDAHMELGHAACLLRALGAQSLEPFGFYKGQSLGAWGPIGETHRDDLAQKLETLLGEPLKLLPFGPGKVRSVGCVTGQGADFSLVREAKLKNVHFYISGEANHPLYHYAKENGVTVALGGHYRTEEFGIAALRQYVAEQFELETFYIDCPTGM